MYSQLLVIGILFFGGPSLTQSATLDVIQQLSSLWDRVVTEAAEISIAAIETSTGGAARTLQAVNLETLQVLVGRKHHLAVEVEGQSYELVLGAEADMLQKDSLLHRETRQEALGDGADKMEATPASSSAAGLLPQDWWRMRETRLALPEVTLSGPLELVLSTAGAVSLFTPLAADVGIVRRLLIGQGVTVRVSGMKSIRLRRPVDLPRLPGSYLAEVYAHSRTKEPGEGYHLAPGILFMSQRLREEANNASASSSLPLLSFEMEAAGPSSLSVSSVGVGGKPGEVAPRLKVKKQKDGSVELSLRPGEVAIKPTQRFNLAALTSVHAWPLPSTPMGSWMTYEDLLRGLLAAHPFDIEKVMRRGIGLKLTKSTIQGVSLLSFDMEVRSKESHPELLGGVAQEEQPLEIWEVVVQIEMQPSGSTTSSKAQPSASGFKFSPMRLQRKAVYGNTYTADMDKVVLLSIGNTTVPLGYESQDLGIARSAAP